MNAFADWTLPTKADDPSVPPQTRDALLKYVRAMTAYERAEFILRQVARDPADGPIIRIIPSGKSDQLRLPILLPMQWQLARWVTDPNGPSTIGVMGGIGVGKTAAGGMLAALVALTRPGSHSLIVGHTKTNLAMNVLPFVEMFLSGPADEEPIFKHDKVAGCYRLNNGSVIWVRHYRIPHGWDEARNPIEGGNINGLLFVEEAEQIHHWIIKHALQRSRGETRGYDGRVYGPTVILNGRPGANRWWMRATKLLGERKAEDARKHGRKVRGVELLIAKTMENPFNGDEYLDNLRANHSRAEFLSITECKPLPLKDAHYSEFKVEDDEGRRVYWPEGNLVPADQYAGPGPVYVSFDPGFNSPAAVIYRLVTLRYQGRTAEGLVILKTLAPSQVPFQALIADIHRECDVRGWHIQGVRGDPAGNATNDHSGLSDYDIVARPRDYDRDAFGGGLGCFVEFPRSIPQRDVRTGIRRTEALVHAMNGDRLLLCTDEVWDEGERLEDSAQTGEQPRTWPYTVRNYTREVSERKRTTRNDHPSTHIADAVRYAVCVDLWASRLPVVPFDKAEAAIRAVEGEGHAAWILED